jgi:hypothetical protein
MLITENVLRRIIAEEYEKLQNEAFKVSGQRYFAGKYEREQGIRRRNPNNTNIADMEPIRIGQKDHPQVITRDRGGMDRPGDSTGKISGEDFRKRYNAAAEVMKDLAGDKKTFSGVMFQKLPNKDEIAKKTYKDKEIEKLGLSLEQWQSELENMSLVYKNS